MTKSVEIDVTREDAKACLAEILQNAESIRKQYERVLDDCKAPLEPLEKEYQVQVHRLLSIAKEIPEIKWELGRIDAIVQAEFIHNTNLFERFFVDGEKIDAFENRFPRIFELRGNIPKANCLYDFYQAINYDNTSLTGTPLPELLWMPKQTVVGFAESEGCSRIGLKRRLLILHLFRGKVLENKDYVCLTPDKEVFSSEKRKHGLFVLVPHSCDEFFNPEVAHGRLVDSLENFYSFTNNNIKNGFKGMLYSGNMNSYINLNPNKKEDIQIEMTLEFTPQEIYKKIFGAELI